MTHPRERQLPWMFTWKMCNFTANSKRICQFNFEQTANKIHERSPSSTLCPQPQICHWAPQPLPRFSSCSVKGGLPFCNAGLIDLIFMFQGWGHWGILWIFFGGVLLQMFSCALLSLWKGRLKKDICSAVSLLSKRAPCNCPMLEKHGVFIIFKHRGGEGEKLIFFFFPPDLGVFLQCNSIWCHWGWSLRCVCLNWSCLSSRPCGWKFLNLWQTGMTIP